MSRPSTGQIFPRGFPVSSSTIVLNPSTAPNLANYTAAANSFSIVQIAGLNSAVVYNSGLTLACTDSNWAPSGVFCNTLYANDQDVIWKFNQNSGAAWSNPNSNSTGVLVVDFASAVIFNAISVFQKFSTGKVTHIQFFSHPSTSAIPPNHTDSQWVSLGSESFIGAGATGYNGFRTSDASIVSNPTKLTFSNTTTRYLKIHARNTGVYGNSSWIEIGGIKVFYN